MLSTYIQLNLAWIMPPYPRYHNIELSVPHEVFDEDEESKHGLKSESDQTLANTRQGVRIQQAKLGVYEVSFSPH